MPAPKPRFLPHLPAETLPALQLEGIRWTIGQAMNSPVYRQRLAEAGVTSPNDIASLADVRRLPFTDTEDLRTGYPLPLLSVPTRDVIRIHASSGTTGKRKILAYTRNDVQTYALQMARCLELAGLTPDDRLQVAVGYGLWSAGVGFQLGSELFGTLTVPVGPGNLDIHLQLLEDMQVTCLGATASMALLLAEEVERKNLRSRLALRKIIFGAEPHSAEMRRTFTEKLGLESSYDIAGMTEMYGPGSGLNCEANEGLHYWADLFYIEIIDPQTLEPVPDGEVGEMVVTSLRKEAVPLIRYRTHDLTSIVPGTCPCGRQIPRHGQVRGRSDDMVVFRGVNIYPGQIVDVLQDFPALGGEYHMELSRKGGKDYILLRVERKPEARAGEDGQLASAIADALRRKILASMDVQVVDPGVLPRTCGKTKRITDSRFDQ